MSSNLRRIAFIGAGNMASALIGGLTKRGLAAKRIVAADPDRGQLDRLVREYAIEAAADNAA
ncbi:MAG TPA: NAD(P)-binding domain-containing protein, partial [Steroidobacteraceae bacterium]|nr:NAD(P)-binding domain-containing protein [Steroidobacteraceae bacterium]